MKHTYIALAALVVTGAVHAQSSWTEIEDESVMVESLDASVGELAGAAVYGVGGEHLGELDDVLMGEDGTVYVSLDVGGFLGIGEKDVAVSVDDLTRTDEGFTVDLTREQIEVLPEIEE